jgi:hypothetical protein
MSGAVQRLRFFMATSAILIFFKESCFSSSLVRTM